MTRLLAALAVAAIVLLPNNAMADPVLVGEPGTTDRVSVGWGGRQLAMDSRLPSLSPDGRYTGFATFIAPPWRPGQSCCSTRVHDRVTGDQRTIALNAFPISFSADGRFIAYRAVQGQMFVHDLWNRTDEIVSVNSTGTPGDSESQSPAISANGRYVVWDSAASNLTAGDDDGLLDVFVRDRASGTTEQISMSANGASFSPSISADGTAVAYQWTDYGGRWDVLVHDRATNETERVTVQEGSSIGRQQAIDGTGRRVVFQSPSGIIFVKDRLHGEVRRVSVDSLGREANVASGRNSAISANGRFVVFSSQATNLVPRDRNAVSDVFVHDLLTGITTGESLDAEGLEANAASDDTAISADGRYVVFRSWADDLVEGDTNDEPDIFVRNRHLLAYTGLAAMADINGNDAPEFAALRVLADGNVEVPITDSATNVLISTVTFPNSDRMVRGVAILPDITGNDSPEVAVLFRRHDGLGVVNLRDAVSGAELPAVTFFGKDWESRAVASLDANGDGAPDIAVLALKDDLSEARVQVRDAVNQVVVAGVRLPAAPGDAYAGVTGLPDLNGNGSPEIAALRIRPDSRQEVVIKDLASGERVSTIHLNVADMHAGGLAAVKGDAGPAIAVLYRRFNGQAKVQIRDARTGEYLNTLTFVGREWESSAIASLDSDSVANVAVLAIKDNGSGVGVQVRDLGSKAQLQWVAFPADDR